MKSFGAALVQMRVTERPEENLRRLEDGVREAASRGAKLVCGPEFFYVSGTAQNIEECCIGVPGPITDLLGDLARKHSIYLSPGSVPEKREDGHPYNTLLMFGPDGAMIGKYRKRHLFRVDMPGCVRHDEREYLSPGDEPAMVIRTPIGIFGAAICYDLRFPELFLQLSLGGAEIVIVPSGFTKPTGEAHWHLLCRARAVETGCFVLAANQAGHTPPSFERYGHSLIVDPWGRILAEAGGGGEVIYAELQAESLVESREKLRSIEHRIPGDSVPEPAGGIDRHSGSGILPV